MTPAIPDSAYSELRGLVVRNVESKASTADEPIFRCQATDWFGASQAVGWWNVRSFLNVVGAAGLLAVLRDDGTDRAREIGSRLHQSLGLR